MKKNKVILIPIVGFAIIILLTTPFIYSSFSSMSKLPKGEFLSHYTSDDGKYTIKTYLCNGGATTDYAVRGELINNKSNKKRNLYWDYKVYDATIKWLDNDTVIINDKELNLPNESYDWRNDKN